MSSESNRHLGAVVGPGRSGTTWAGTLINSCPDVIYRFEPFHRLSLVDSEMREWFRRLRNQEVTESDLPSIYTQLCKAHPLTDKAPFFSEKSYPLRTVGRSQLWPAARLLPLVGKLYGALYSPRPGPALVFKEVTFIKPLQNLLNKTSIPIVYVVRHPCATVMSTINVQMRNGIPQRIQQLRETLKEHAPQLAEENARILDGPDVVSRAALLWRYEVEKCVTLVRESKRGVVMTYEQLAEDPHSQTKVMFAHLGIYFGSQTERYIDSLLDLKAEGRRSIRDTGWASSEFNVNRNPREQKESWKRKIAPEDCRKIEAIVQGVPAIDACAALGGWW